MVYFLCSGNQSVLSTSYKIMVDVPDPPNNDIFSDESNEDGTESPSGIERSKSPVPAKIHHLFVKVPPKQTAKFERMVRRNRTLEHEVKVYHELLRDMHKFINDRLPRNPIQLNIPKLYHGFTDTTTEEKTGSPNCLLVWFFHFFHLKIKLQKLATLKAAHALVRPH